jgi:hypothetical protein
MSLTRCPVRPKNILRDTDTHKSILYKVVRDLIYQQITCVWVSFFHSQDSGRASMHAAKSMFFSWGTKLHGP